MWYFRRTRTHFFHTGKWFQVFLSNANNSIKHSICVNSQALNGMVISLNTCENSVTLGVPCVHVISQALNRMVISLNTCNNSVTFAIPSVYLINCPETRTIISSNTCDNSIYSVLDFFNLDDKFEYTLISFVFMINQCLSFCFCGGETLHTHTHTRARIFILG